MNNNPIFQYLQQSFWLTVGATATLIETLQEPQKRADAWSQFQTQWEQKSQEWSEKGEVTEQEARKFIENWINSSRNNASSPVNENNVEDSLSSSEQSTAQAVIQELTEQIVALKTELEELRQNKS